MANRQVLMLMLPIIVMLLFVIALFAVTGLWRGTAIGREFFPSRKRSPLRDSLLRSPGQTLQDKLLDTMIDFALTACSGVFMLVVVCFVPFLLRLGALAIMVWLIFGLILLWILYKLGSQSKAMQRLKLGVDGELATAEELNQLMHYGYYVFHDFPANKFNIDHVVIGPAGVFAVETKTRSKADEKGRQVATVIFDGDQLIFPDYQGSEFIRQAKDQAKWLSDFLRKSVGRTMAVKPVLTMPGWMVKSRTKDPSILVINPKQAVPIITSTAKKLNEQTIQQIKYQVEQRCRTVKPYRPI
jgi:predicted ester cyclase